MLQVGVAGVGSVCETAAIRCPADLADVEGLQCASGARCARWGSSGAVRIVGQKVLAFHARCCQMLGEEGGMHVGADIRNVAAPTAEIGRPQGLLRGGRVAGAEGAGAVALCRRLPVVLLDMLQRKHVPDINASESLWQPVGLDSLSLERRDPDLERAARACWAACHLLLEDGALVKLPVSQLLLLRKEQVRVLPLLDRLYCVGAKLERRGP